MRPATPPADDEELLAAIVASRPPGYFDHAMPLLRRFVALSAASHAVHERLRRIDIGSPRAHPVLTEMCRITEELCDIAEWLHLCPGDQYLGFPPPKMQ